MKLTILFGTFAALVGCVGVDNSQFKLRTAIDANQAGLTRCYTQALVNDGEMEGTMRLVVRVPRSSEHVDMVEPSGESQLTNPQLMAPLHHCFERALMGLAIGSAPVNDDLYVEYAFQLTRDGNTAFLTPAPTGPKAGARVGLHPVEVDGNVDANVDANASIDIRNGRPKVRGSAKVNVKAGIGIR